MGITFKEVEDNNLISKEVLQHIPRHCECGAELQFTESLVQLYCPNEACYIKVASRLEAMAKDMSIDGFGESTCIEICRRFGLKSPYQIFLIEDYYNRGGRCDTVSAFDKKVKAICDKTKRHVKLWEFVRYGNIPSMKDTAYKIFDGYENIEEAYIDIEKGQVPFIANKLGLKSNESSVLAVKVYNVLIQHKDELLFGEKLFDIYKPSGDVLKIAITGGVYGYRNKAEFIKYINERYNGKINAMLMSSVTKDIDVLIADGDTSSKKYNNAQKINHKYIEETEDTDGYKDDINREFHPAYEKIFITESKGLIERLDSIYM